MRFFISCLPHSCLFFKTLPLLEGIGQLRKGIGQFHAGYQQLKTVSLGWILTVGFGQGRNLFRRIDDKRRLNNFFLGHLVKNDIKSFGIGGRFRLRGKSPGQFHHFFFVLEPVCRQPAVVENGLFKFQPGPGLLKGNQVIAIRQFFAAMNLPGQKKKQVFSHLHQLIIIDISLIKLQHGKFRVMLRINPFIAKTTINFIDFFHSADDQSFEVEFGSNSEIEIYPQSLMESLKRAGQSSTRHNMHHRSFDFDKATAIKVLTYLFDQLTSYSKGLP